MECHKGAILNSHFKYFMNLYLIPMLFLQALTFLLNLKKGMNRSIGISVHMIATEKSLLNLSKRPLRDYKYFLVLSYPYFNICQ